MHKSWGRLIDKFEDVIYDLKIESTYILSYNIWTNEVKIDMHAQSIPTRITIYDTISTKMK